MPNNIVVGIEPGWTQTFGTNQNSVVGRDLDRRAQRVQVAAVAQAGLLYNRLKPSIQREFFRSGRPDTISVRVGSNVRHALIHHEGSRSHLITARQGGVLRYINKQGRVVYARSVVHPGHRANRYLSDSLPLAIR
jgi:hypothetical protein